MRLKILQTLVVFTSFKTTEAKFDCFKEVAGLFASKTVPSNKQDSYITYTSNLPAPDEELLIPKIFHQIWFDFGNGKELPIKYENNLKILKELHPTWTIKQWSEEDVEDLIKQKFPWFYQTYKSYDHIIKKHDSCRAAILYCYGGVYIDHDMIALKNIEPLLRSYRLVFGNEKYNYFQPCNGVMASVRNYKFFRNYLRRMSCPYEAQKIVLAATGPYQLRNVLQEHVQKYGSKHIKIYDMEFLYPCDFHDRFECKNLTVDQIKEKYPIAYLFHQYDYTWENDQ